jgi:adenylate cyclase
VATASVGWRRQHQKGLGSVALLRIYSAGSTSERVLSEGRLTIGRAPANDLVLKDEAVSSRHAELTLGADGWVLRDLGSTNKTFLNGQEVNEAVRLSHGDHIRLGRETDLTFEDAPGAPQQAHEIQQELPPGSSMEFLQSLVGEEDTISGSGAGLSHSLVIDEVTESVDHQGSWELLCVDGARPAPRDELKTAIDFDPRRSWTIPPRPVARRPGESLAEAKLRLIQRVSEKLVRIFDPKQLVEEILSIVLEQTRADRGILCLFDEKSQPVPIATRGLAEGQPVRMSRTVLERMLRERSGVLISAHDDDPNSILRSMAEMQIHSTLCAPLWTGDRIIGFCSLDASRPGKAFSPEDLEMLLAVAHQAAVGIERGRLGQQVEKERKLSEYLSKYLDNNLVQQISDTKGDDPLAPAEREVTVLFSDIVSFTKLCEGLEPAQVAQFISEYLTAMTEVIFNHGGMVDKYIGDAVMALFGAPLADENSPANAIRAAVEMRERLRDIRLPGGRTTPLRARYGINTGRVVVGNIGSARRREYTAIGDAVNVAARLQTFARPNEICIDESTSSRAADQFALEEIGTIDVKNRAQPVVVFKVLRSK